MTTFETSHFSIHFKHISDSFMNRGLGLYPGTEDVVLCLHVVYAVYSCFYIQSGWGGVKRF